MLTYDDGHIMWACKQRKITEINNSVDLISLQRRRQENSSGGKL